VIRLTCWLSPAAVGRIVGYIYSNVQCLKLVFISQKAANYFVTLER